MEQSLIMNFDDWSAVNLTKKKKQFEEKIKNKYNCIVDINN